jgi:hypothetical protein
MSRDFNNAPLLYAARQVESLQEFLDVVDLDGVDALWRDIAAFGERSVTGEVSEPIAFMRIPKCATTSVHYELARAYRSVRSAGDHGIRLVHHGACDRAADIQGEPTWEMRRRALTYYLAHPDSRYVYGHYEVSGDILDAFHDEWSFVTLMRHPVDRWISHYLYNKYLPRDRYDIDVSMEEFVETERGRGIGQMYTAYLTGTGHLGPDTRDTDEIRREARENLEKFEVVGLVEQMDRFTDRLGDRFDIEVDPRRRNKSPAPEGASEVSDDLRDKIREVCQMDVELYEYARDEM